MGTKGPATLEQCPSVLPLSSVLRDLPSALRGPGLPDVAHPHFRFEGEDPSERKGCRVRSAEGEFSGLVGSQGEDPECKLKRPPPLVTKRAPLSPASPFCPGRPQVTRWVAP